MNNITLIVLSAGSSSRFTPQVKKQWLRCGDEPLWLYVTNKLNSFSKFDKIIIVGHNDEVNYMKNFTTNYTFVMGGNTRQQSIINALQKVTTKYVMTTDVARSCIPKKIIKNLISNRAKASCIVPYLNIHDTIVYQDKTINRDDVKIIQTPQLSTTKILREALDTKTQFTDDSSAIANINGTIYYIEGDNNSTKLTTSLELKNIKCLPNPNKNTFTGTGFDIHQFEHKKPMFLGGIKIDSDFGFKAHSDGDVLIHSLIDALLGAAGAGDIGEYFPDTSDKFKNIDSTILLEKVLKLLVNTGFEIVNIDLTVIAQKPKLHKYKSDIKSKLSALLHIPIHKINIKATTAEKLGFVGREEGVAVQSLATLKFYDWKEE
ncbi:2-C-methyl-D-erythritol 4-phosphate cytidylyltransferase / 2-C-methyl-D-erythritol 2,4-cyclodiphosphate synthase [hydrothermal vent metagenome]|uniref:2-C-methyl-D-erythritol 2,4-cyclodiphosphate synthase n=1 Tax=hydrothermal vent metagenome TaxID=652676 RepID=A0A3B1E7I8_9ZZZZ